MNHSDNPIPIVSRPQGNVDEGSLISWLGKHHPATLTQPDKVQNVKSFIEDEAGYFVITSYQTPTKHKFLRVRVKWELEVDEQPYELWSTLYTTIQHPGDLENLRNVVLAKAQVLMLAQTYCDYIMAIVDPGHVRHALAAKSLMIFQMMKHFSVETTPTGRVRKFMITTTEGQRHEATQVVTPYFRVSQINHYESMTMIKGNVQDLLHKSLREEEAGHLNRNLVEYYTWCGKRYCQTFEEAYTRLVDVIADDHVQRCLCDLKEMEKGVHQTPISVSDIRQKYDDIITFLSKDSVVAKYEFLIMEDCYQHIQELIEKFVDWLEHPELSLAQTSLLEKKIDILTRGLEQKRILIAELRGRFDDIEYWAGWFKKQFPTLFRFLDRDDEV